jgi:ketosteroid isomerase-like protein
LRREIGGMKVFFVIAAVVAAVSLSPATRGASPDAERELLEINKEYDTASMRGDVAALERIFAEEFIYTNPQCEVLTKQQQIAVLSKGDLKLEDVKSDDVRVRIYGETAVMTGHFTARATRQGKPMKIDERYTAVWVRRDGRWQIVAEQGNFKK